MGGGGRYPYPKFVWSPAGGWWSQPANWKMNTFIASCGIALVCGAIVRGVAHREAELAGEPLERRRLTTIWRAFLHKRAADAHNASLEAAKQEESAN
ncbi:hypothetical protein C8R44DRAFT_763162 [Mycena epipterygia]|nr:hypothetical protein C8R44DRAFT_763162 [Mycena epipterygia]